MKETFDLFECATTPEHWIVNPTDKNIIVYCLYPNRQYITKRPYTEGDHIAPLLFPNFLIPVNDIFNW